MLAVAEKPAKGGGINNVSFAEADAHALGFDDASFGVVTVALHHSIFRTQHGSFVRQLGCVVLAAYAGWSIIWRRGSSCGYLV